LHSILQFVWHRLLHVIGGVHTTVVGTIVSGRHLPIDGIEDTVGLFINTLPLIVDHGELAEKSVHDALVAIQHAVNVMNSRSTVELGRLEYGGVKRRLFDTLLVLENYPEIADSVEAECRSNGLLFETLYDSDRVDYPIAVVAREESGGLSVNLWYAGELFDDGAVDALLESMQILFEQVAGDFFKPVKELEYVPADGQARFDEWNRTDADFDDQLTLARAFEKAAQCWPDQVALAYRETQLSYRELNERANRLAHYLLHTSSLRPDDVVALVMDKSQWMIIAILAVWKAGAALVPVDPEYPDERIAYMLDDASARLVMADDVHLSRLEALRSSRRRDTIGIQRLRLNDFPLDNPDVRTSSRNLAYAIYTSGTTGKPKAVLIEHRGVVNLHTSLEKLFSLNRRDGEEAILSFSNYVFDHFFEQMLDALLSGQKLVVLDDDLRTDRAGLCQYMKKHGVTYLSGTPSVLSMYEYADIPSLKRIDAIGEDFTFPVFDRIRESFEGMIINGYGPTEISITSHKRLYQPGERRHDKSIGFPVANTKCYVLDNAMKRVPIGAIGELYIGGIGVARGYLNREALSRERFIPNPFQSHEEQALGNNERLYKTGDLVRWLPNGELEYLGRSDMQVKIRGIRVEFGEIEAVLSSYPGVSKALVIAREHARAGESAPSQKYLVGFYISSGELSERDLARWMRAKLPDHLVPARFLRISEVPITPSGKLNVAGLPATSFSPGSGRDYVAPSRDIEHRLCRIWSQVLGLPMEHIGIRDDFFGLGGDSLRAIRLAQRIAENLGRRFDVSCVFDHPSVEAQAEYLQAQEGVDRADREFSGIAPPAFREWDSPVSYAQERLLFIDDFLGGTSAYNIPFVVEIARSDRVSYQSIADALRSLVARHGSLRTLLGSDRNGLKLQRVLEVNDALARFRIQEYTVENKYALDRMLVAESEHVFRLDSELPLRAALCRVTGVDDASYLSLVFHHICFDGWSWDIFRKEFQALIGGLDVTRLPPLATAYSDYALWQRRHLGENRLSTLCKFWQTRLEGVEPLNLSTDFPRPVEFDHRGGEIVFEVDAPTAARLKAAARAAQVSFFSLLMGAFCVILKNYSGRKDIVLGVPSANRERPEFADVIGFFANLLVMRVVVDETMPLSGYLQSVGAVVRQAQKYQDLPFEQIVKSLAIERDTSRHPLVQVAFSFVDDEANGGSWRPPFKPYSPDNSGLTSTKFDLSVTVTEGGSGLAVNFTYARSLWAPQSIRTMGERFARILSELARLGKNVDTVKLSHLLILHETERSTVVDKSVDATSRWKSKADRPRTLSAKFESVVRQRPGWPAVIHKDKSLKYSELNELANRIARWILEHGEIGQGGLVALVMDKSEWMIASILAVWKLGAAYMPIDPEWPDDRLAFMLEDARIGFVVADNSHADRLRDISRNSKRQILAIQELPASTFADSNLDRNVLPSDLAYVIYTSGTTGKPKGVLIKHCNVVEFCEDIATRYFGEARAERHRVLFLANYVFDFSIEQLCLSIISGNTLVIPETASFLDAEFYRYARLHGVTYLSGTPTQLQQIDLAQLCDLRMVLVAGEPFQKHHYEKIRREYEGPLLNAYGTTETTVYNTVKWFEAGDAYRNSLGAALSNTQLFVLDGALRLLPPGAEGELCIAGDGVGSGYLNRLELTQQHFVPNPYQTEEQKHEGRCTVLYRTGDVVRRNVDGELEFLGRHDLQVKINGVRIELSEIEAVIAAFPGVQECAVVTRDDGSAPGTPRLVAFYVGNDEADERELRKFLRKKLVASMVPANLVRLDGALPLSSTGKLDRNALRTFVLSDERAPYAAPLSRAEARLCEIWADVLHRPTIGVDDDFFRCGGDSIVALQLVSRIQREFGRRVSVKLIFEHPTVRAFANGVLDEEAQGGAIGSGVSEDSLRLSGLCPMLPIQRWFFAKPLKARSHWNQYFTIRTPLLDVARLRTALNALVAHHDAFHLRFRAVAGAKDGGFEQFYSDSSPEAALTILNVSQLGELGVDRYLEDLQCHLDLENGPLFEAAYLQGFGDDSGRIWIAMHHLVTDAFSWRIIARDLEIIYHGGTLGPRECSYREWTQAVLAYTPVQDEVKLWSGYAQATSAGQAAFAAVEVLPLRMQFTLAKPETSKLLGDSNRMFDTQILDLMLTAMGLAMSAISGEEVNLLALEGHGREEFDGAPNVQDTVGWFTAMYPLAVIAKGDIGASIVATKASRACIPRRGIGYGALRGTYGSANAPIPNVTFNYLGRFIDADNAVPKEVKAESARWALDPHLCGISKSREDAGADRSALDVTARCIGENLVVEIESRLGLEISEQFLESLKSSLETIVSYTSGETSPSPREAASLSSPIDASHEFEPYILVNERIEGTTLFILPPGEGGAESYLGNIARQLPALRLVLFNNIQRFRPMRSYEALAEYYLKYIRDIQPHGPYHLFGWSFGGVLSFEIARQLSVNGEAVENLLLVDPFFDIRKAAKNIGLPDKARNLLDPINYDYQPTMAGIERLCGGRGRIILYKATQPVEDYRGEEQRRLFDYYARSECNNLDSLLPARTFTVESLVGRSHFSWVLDKELVETLGVHIQSVILRTEEAIAAEN
jgi:N-(5-amino-5-carboxypentanoyl)-L-cysteinyl-D-valine synthase